MAVIDKESREPAGGLLKEESLAIVRVPSANVDHPSQPEALAV